MRHALAAALLLAAAAVPALAENATAPVLPGDTLHGNILAAGDFDRIEVYLPGGAVVDADLRPEKGSALLPALSLLDPLGDPVDLTDHLLPGTGGAGAKLKKFVVEEGGVHSFLVTAGAGGGGKYSLRVKSKDPKKAPAVVHLPEAPTADLALDARAGALLSYSVKSLEGEELVVTLTGPAGPVPGAGGLKAARLPAPDDGTYTLSVDGPGATFPAVASSLVAKPPKPSKRHLWLSSAGFGEAPVVTLVTPGKVLDDRAAPGIAVEGEGFDPGAVVRLERKGQEPLLPSAFEIQDDGNLTADFDVTGVKPGKWSLVVENPSGGAGSGKLVVQAAGAVKLPAGIVKDTEVWWLDFDETDFPSDLAAMGLGSSSSTVAGLAEGAVKSYTLFWLRKAFALQGVEGQIPDTGTPVPVSFTVERPPTTVGEPGVAYNRLQVGGAAAEGDPSSNPSYPWGTSPVDAGNLAFEDVGRDASAGLGVRARVLAPSAGHATASWTAALAPFATTPLSAADAPLFSLSFVPSTDAEMARYRDLARALETVGKELAGTIAHFVGRAMGLADGVSGLSAVPGQVGEYAALATFGFSEGERAALAATRRDPDLPGSSKSLRAAYLPLRSTRAYLLPNAESANAYTVSLQISGGRPDKDADDLEFEGVQGSIPLGWGLTQAGVLSGTAPLFVPDQGRTFYAGAFKFVVRVADARNGDALLFTHRLNLLVDADNPALSGPEQSQAATLNAQILASP
jgi:hypothetical protein